jgi:hypothetical protein
MGRAVSCRSKDFAQRQRLGLDQPQDIGSKPCKTPVTGSAKRRFDIPWLTVKLSAIKLHDSIFLFD